MKKVFFLILALPALLLSTGCLEEDFGLFDVEIEGKALIIDHLDYFNACDYAVSVDVTVRGNVVNIHEYYDGDPAKCSCFYDNRVVVNNLEAGEYDVHVWKDYLGLMFSTSITVYDVIGQPGEGESYQEVEYFTANSDCMD